MHEGHEHDEKDTSRCCDNCGNCGYCGSGHHSGKKGKIYILLGVLAIVYGIINYLIVVAGMPDYNAWIFGGVLLVFIGMLKKYMAMKN